jgi:hypothetical protein
VYGPTVAMLEVRSDFVLWEFVSECHLFAACDVSYAAVAHVCVELSFLCKASFRMFDSRVSPVGADFSRETATSQADV